MDYNERIAALVWLQNAGQAQYVDFAARVGQFMIDDLHDDGMIEDVSAEGATTATYKITENGRYIIAAYKQVEGYKRDVAELASETQRLDANHRSAVQGIRDRNTVIDQMGEKLRALEAENAALKQRVSYDAPDEELHAEYVAWVGNDEPMWDYLAWLEFNYRLERNVHQDARKELGELARENAALVEERDALKAMVMPIVENARFMPDGRITLFVRDEANAILCIHTKSEKSLSVAAVSAIIDKIAGVKD